MLCEADWAIKKSPTVKMRMGERRMRRWMRGRQRDHISCDPIREMVGVAATGEIVHESCLGWL